MLTVQVDNPERMTITYNEETRIVRLYTTLDAYVIKSALDMVYMNATPDASTMERIQRRKLYELFVLHNNVVRVPFYAHTENGVGFVYVVPEEENDFVDDTTKTIAKMIFQALHKTALPSALLIDDAVSISNIESFRSYPGNVMKFNGELRAQHPNMDRFVVKILHTQEVINAREIFEAKNGFSGHLANRITRYL